MTEHNGPHVASMRLLVTIMIILMIGTWLTVSVTLCRKVGSRSGRRIGVGDTFRIGNYTDKVTVPSPEASGSFYDLHPDGERLLQTSIDPAFRAEVSYLHLVTDWRRGLVQ